MPKWIDDLNKAVQEAEKHDPIKNALNAGVNKLQQNVNMITPDMGTGWQALKGLGQIGTNFAGGLVSIPDVLTHPIEAGKQMIDMSKQYQKDYLNKEGLNNIKKDPSRFVGDTYNMIGLAEGVRQGVKALNTPKPSPAKVNIPPAETYKPKAINKSMGGDGIKVKVDTKPSLEKNLKKQYFEEAPVWTEDVNFNPNYMKDTIYSHGSFTQLKPGQSLKAETLKPSEHITDRGMWDNAAYMSVIENEPNAMISNSYAQPGQGATNNLVQSVNSTYLMNADVPIGLQSPNVKAAYRNYYRKLGYPDDIITSNMLEDTGQMFFDRVKSDYGSNTANLMLNANGIPGMTGKYSRGSQSAIFREANNKILGNLDENAYFDFLEKAGVIK